MTDLPTDLARLARDEINLRGISALVLARTTADGEAAIDLVQRLTTERDTARAELERTKVELLACGPVMAAATTYVRLCSSGAADFERAAALGELAEAVAVRMAREVTT
jgi:hypothetical protein